MHWSRYRNEEGQVVIVLPLIVLLLIIMGLVVKTLQTGTAGNVLRNTAAIAARGAAGQFTSGQPPPDPPSIDFTAARYTFENLLRQNLELYGDMTPDQYSAFTGAVDYSLTVYNGDAGVIYSRQDGAAQESPLQGTGFPRTFTLKEGLTVTLNSPGTVVIIRAGSDSVYGQPVPIERWAAAELKKKDGNWRAHTVGSD